MNGKIKPPTMLAEAVISEPFIPLKDYGQRFPVKNEYDNDILLN